MTEPTSRLDAAAFLRLLLRRGEPDIGQQTPGGLGGPVASSQLPQQPGDVLEFVGAVQSGSGHLILIRKKNLKAYALILLNGVALIPQLPLVIPRQPVCT